MAVCSKWKKYSWVGVEIPCRGITPRGVCILMRTALFLARRMLDIAVQQWVEIYISDFPQNIQDAAQFQRACSSC